MNKFTVGNQSMAYLDEGEGPVVVLGHSYLWDSAMWEAWVWALKSQYRCIVLSFGLMVSLKRHRIEWAT